MRFKRHREAELELNMTSMLDVVFLLIIFFILVTNFSAADLPPLQPPDPTESTARKEENQVTRTVNIVPVTNVVTRDGKQVTEMIGQASHIKAFGEDVPLSGAGYQRLTDLLVTEKERQAEQEKEMIVDLRVHKTIPFKQVQPIMRAVAAAKIKRVNLVALVDTSKPQN